MVEDIPIFAFKRFEGNNVASVERKLMSNNNVVKDKEPPDRNDIVSEYSRVQAYSKEFTINAEEKFIFYVAIARYIYDKKKGGWKKEWIQTNSSDEVLWGKAKEGK